jgi:hypothetical protein
MIIKYQVYKKRLRRYIKRARGWRHAFMVLTRMYTEVNEREKQVRQRLLELQRRFGQSEQDHRIRNARAEAAYQDAIRSRFYELVGADQGDHHPGRHLRPISTRQASQLVDLADQHESPPALLYLGDDGQLLPVVVGEVHRHQTDPDGNGDLPYHYASAPFLAGGEVVGYIHFTDH